MARLEYQSLLNITHNTDPYRGTKNKYPLVNRKQSYKYFISDYLNGEKVFRIFYGKTYREVFLPNDEAVAVATARGEYVVKRPSGGMPFYHESVPNEVGIVYPDNTFQLIAKSLSQGLCTVLNDLIGGYMFRSSRHGGYVYNSLVSSRGQAVFHPLFKGIRFGLGEDKGVHESSKYQLFGRSVNRKESKKLMSKYADMFKVSEIMAKTMKPEDFVLTAVEVANDAYGIDILDVNIAGHVYADEEKKYKALRMAEERLESAPLDALLIYAVVYQVDGMQLYRLFHQAVAIKGLTASRHNAYYARLLNPESVVEATKRKLSRDLYENTPEVMNVRELETGKPYGQSDWGFTLMVNGKEVEQY